MISETLAVVAQVGILAFVVTGMLSMGASLTVRQILEPLRNGRLVVAVLLANFVAVPALAWLLGRLLPVDDAGRTALILLGTMAGAPFLPKLAQLAKGNLPFAVGLMVLLMVVTIVYAPIVVPLLVQGVEISPWDIARSLIFLMLLPLAIALVARERYPEVAGWAPDLARISSASMVIAGAAAILVSYREIFGAVGSWIFVGSALLAVGSVVIGWLLAAGGDAPTRSVAGLGTGQRNLSAAFLVAGTNFGADTIVMTMVASLTLTILLLVLAGEVGKRAAAAVAASPNLVEGSPAATPPVTPSA